MPRRVGITEDMGQHADMTTGLPPPPTTRKARSTYEGLIAATREVVRSEGRVDAERIAAAAALSPATFYSYFSSKDAALAAAFDRALDDMLRQLDEHLTIERLLEFGLAETVRSLVWMVARGFTHDARVFRLTMSRLPESEVLRTVYRHHDQALTDKVERFVRLGMSAGQIRVGESRPMAEAIVVSVQGFQNPLIVRQGASPLLEELTTMLTKFLTP